MAKSTACCATEVVTVYLYIKVVYLHKSHIATTERERERNVVVVVYVE